jgi:parallel beta-helix repeat protein
MKYINTVVIIAALLDINAAYATVWYVHPDSAMNCIQHCLDSCSTGDTVLVGPGTYYENINWPSTSGIDLISENGSTSTIIDGGGIGRVIRIAIGVSQSTLVEGFTIQNGFDHTGGAGIDCAYGASPVIRGNQVINNVTDSAGAGILCAYNASPLIDSNTIMNNTSHYFAAGICCWSNSHPTIQNNTVINNVADFNSGGIGCVGSSPLITGNTIIGNTGGEFFGGIGADDASAPTIRDNTITDNVALWGAGMGLYGYGVIVGNNISGNVADSSGGGVACHTNSTALIDSNIIFSNSANKGGGIWVHYYSNPTIRNNNISQNQAVSGAGIRCSNYSNPNIYNNVIENNDADTAGGGITCVYGSSPTITDNTISGNTAGYPGGSGIFCMDNSSPYIENNMINNNTANNGTGSIFCYTSSSPVIRNNTIINNMATRAAGIQVWRYSSPEIKRNIITSNYSPGYGCGIDCDSFSSPDIDSCTIASNIGDGICCGNSSNPEIHFVNIYGNSGYGMRNIDAAISIDAENNWWGHATGPYNAYYNPSGLGDSVSYFVDFDPWLSDSVVWQIGIDELEMATLMVLNLQVSPNPFTQLTNIRFMIHDPRYTEQELRNSNFEMRKPLISIYDANGRIVKSFNHESCIQDHGSAISWRGDDNAGRELPSGVYFVNLTVGDCTESRKILLIR